MPQTITRADFLSDRQGSLFEDVLDDEGQPFAAVLRFFNDSECQRRMEEAEIHHSRAPLTGVIRELEAREDVGEILSGEDSGRAQRLRQTIGILVRMVMERRGWKKTNRTGSLGVRAETAEPVPVHNQRGLSLWFARAERYQLVEGMPFMSVKRRLRVLEERYR